MKMITPEKRNGKMKKKQKHAFENNLKMQKCK